MAKMCIFNNKKVCTDCGECNICEIDRNKICDNCGKCLELEGFDVKAINIDEVIEMGSSDNEGNMEDTDVIEENESSEKETCCEENDFEIPKEDKDSDYIDVMDIKENWTYIDDVKDLSDIFNDPELKEKIMGEEFPGLLKFKDGN